MTLGIVLFSENNKIIIISDKRVTGGTYSLSTHGDFVEKIHKVTDKCGLTIAGNAGAATTVIDLFHKEIQVELTKRASKFIPVSDAAEIFRRIAVENFTKWYKDMTMKEWVENIKEKVIPFFEILLAGFDLDEKGKPTKRKIVELSSYNRFAPTSSTVNFATIGITSIAQYLLYRFYHDNQKEEVIAGLGAFCITETNSQSDDVGNDFQIATFSDTKSFEFYNEDKLHSTKIRCAELKTELETSLLTSKKIRED